LNPEIDLFTTIDKVIYNDFILKLSPLLSENIPIKITKPVGEPPQGYQFLDVWPQHFFHTVRGPERLIKKLQKKGLELTFDLSEIKKSDLDPLQNALPGNDELFFFVPNEWKIISLPFFGGKVEEINDLSAFNLHMVFLREERLLIDRQIPITLFFPYLHRKSINPEKYALKEGPVIKTELGMNLLTKQIFAKNISRQFLELVKDHMQIVITTEPLAGSNKLNWSLQFINIQTLENQYVSRHLPKESGVEDFQPKLHEKQLRNRFREYVRRITLVNEKGKEIELDARLTSHYITVK
jgi:hypothetical protein